MIYETKMDDSFLNGQFQIKGFNLPNQLYGDKNGCGIMIFIRQDIPLGLP